MTISGSGQIDDFETIDDIPWFKGRPADGFSISGNLYVLLTQYIKTIIVEEGVTKLGDMCFFNHDELTSISIPNSVLQIGEKSFQMCKSLSRIGIPNSVRSIGNEAFADCKSLSEITLPSSITSIGYNCFSNCTALESIQIPNDVKALKYRTFYGCSSLKNVTLPTDLTDIATECFRECSALENINIPNKVTAINDAAFYECVSLKNITLPNSLETIGDNCFEECSSLTNIVMPDNITKFGNYCFNGCSSLTEFTFPKFSTQMGKGCFQNCNNLATVNLSSYIISIPDDCFLGCSSLVDIDLDLNNTTSIGSNAFSGCSSLTDMNIPNYVTSLGTNIFNDCHNLDRIMFWPNTYSYTDNRFGNFSGTLYVQDGIKEKMPNAEYTVSSLNDYYLDSKYDIGEDEIAVTLVPKFSNVHISNLQYRKAISDYYNIIEANTDGLYTISDVNWPEYEIKIVLNIDGMTGILYKNLQMDEKPGLPSLSLEDSTQTTLSFVVNVSENDYAHCTECGIYDGYDYIKADDNRFVKVSGFYPGAQHRYKAYAKYDDVELLSDGDVFYSTQSMSPDIEVTEASPSAVSAVGSYAEGDATVLGSGFTETASATEFISGNEMTMTGLRPNNKYTLYYAVNTEEGGFYRTSKEVTTAQLELVTETAQPTSTTSVRLMASTNLSEAETNVGFEWRRYDAPDEMPSNVVACPVVDGMLTGSLRNVNPEVYYKYRPYYEASDGSKYYGEWVVFFTGDATVYFEPEVRTYEPEKVTSGGATLMGYALEGTDDITSQGFEYWPTSAPANGMMKAAGGVQTVLASGIKMEAALTGLQPETTYSYRAFAATEKGTVYGTEMQFTTEPVGGINEVVENGSMLTVSLRNNPVSNGTAWVKVGGADAETLRYTVTSAAGQNVAAGEIAVAGEWAAIDVAFPAGIYLLTVTDGSNAATVKMVVR